MSPKPTRVNIHKNIDSPQSTPNISMVRSSRSSQAFLKESGVRSREQSRDHSNYSGGYSALNKIGFLKKKEKTEGTLYDFMQGDV